MSNFKIDKDPLRKYSKNKERGNTTSYLSTGLDMAG